MNIPIGEIRKQYRILGLEPDKHGINGHKNDKFYCCQCVKCGYIRKGNEAIRFDYLNPNDKKTIPCPQCGLKWKISSIPTELKVGAQYNGCTIIEQTGKSVPKRGEIFRLQDNETGEKFWRYSFDLRDGYKWHSPNKEVATDSLLAKEGRKILEEEKVNFCTQMSFDDLKTDNGRPYFFDIYCPKINTLIEFDGEQHYKDYQTGIYKNTLSERQVADKIKEEWCIKHEKNLIRIPYWKQGKITIEDMMPFLSDFHIIKFYKCY